MRAPRNSLEKLSQGRRTKTVQGSRGKTSVFGLAINEQAIISKKRAAVNERLTNKSTSGFLAGINEPAVA